MKKCIVLVLVALASVALVGCGGKNKQAAMPAQLPELAAKFKAAAEGEAKIELGKQIKELLPTCTRGGADGGLAVIDYDNPTYMLKLPELYALLGMPSEADPGGQYCAYNLGKDDKTSYYLLVELYSDYVSSARIDAGK